jgi:hypothetical protein
MNRTEFFKRLFAVPAAAVAAVVSHKVVNAQPGYKVDHPTLSFPNDIDRISYGTESIQVEWTWQGPPVFTVGQRICIEHTDPFTGKTYSYNGRITRIESNLRMGYDTVLVRSQVTPSLSEHVATYTQYRAEAHGKTFEIERQYGDVVSIKNDLRAVRRPQEELFHWRSSDTVSPR